MRLIGKQRGRSPRSAATVSRLRALVTPSPAQSARVITNLNSERAMLWTPTTAARNRPDPWVVEIIAGVHLRATYALADGDVVEIVLVE